jgi:Flp pilus assembly protein TadD
MATDQPPIDRTSRSALGLLVLLAALPYLNTLTAGFALDDLPNIRENAAVTRGVDLTEIFATPLPLLSYLYRPFTVLTFALNEAVAPGNAALFHAVNVVLHAAVTVVVYWLGVRLFTARVALLAAALFALHPVHTEAVTSIVGRAELLATLFGVLAVLGAGAADDATGRWSRRGWYVASILSFAIAVFSKESAATVLPLLLLYRVTRRGDALCAGVWKEVRSLQWIPYALCFGIFLFLRFVVVGTLGGMPLGRLIPLDNVLAFVPWPVRVCSALGVVWDYFGLLNLPLVLSADYSYNQVPVLTSWLDPRCLAGLLLCVAAGVGIVVCRPAVRFSIALPFVALLLTANLLFPIGTIKAERLLYFPSVGWVFLVALVFDQGLRAPRYRVAAAALLVLVTCGFATRTWLRNGDWHDDFTLAHSVGATAPGSAKSLSNFGVALLKQGRPVQAMRAFRAALAIYPIDESAFGIGTALMEQGQSAAAIGWFRRTLEIEPTLVKAHTDLCHALLAGGDFAAAARACRNGLRYAPADANLLKGLAASLMGAGETEKATAILHRALALDSDDDRLRTTLALLDSAVARRDGDTEVRR